MPEQGGVLVKIALRGREAKDAFQEMNHTSHDHEVRDDVSRALLMI